MHKRAYLHQFDQLGEDSVAAIAATLRLADIREVAAKTHQGTTWLGNATTGDSSPLAFRSLEDVAARFAAFAAEGIAMVPWCVPVGDRPSVEGVFAGEVAKAAAGVIELDTEPYKDFWEGPYNNLLPYTDAIQATGAAYEVNFDARPSGWHPFTASQFSAVCRDADAVWTQSYWTDFQRDAVAVVTAALEVLRQLEVPEAKQGIIMPWDGPEDYERAVRQIQDVAPGAGRIGMWRMGVAGPPVYAALARIPTGPPPTTTPISDGPPRDRTYDLAQQIRALKGSWQRAGFQQHAEGIDAAAYAVERFVVTSKGED